VTRLLVVTLVTAALGGLFVWGLLRGSPDRDVASARLDREVPAFELPLYPRYQAEFGPAFNVGEALGQRPVIVNFWASWCGPCYVEAPDLQTAWERWGDEVLFVGVQTQDRGKRAEGRAFVEQFDLGFPNVIDDDSAISIDYGLFGVPETFFVRRDGTLMYKHTGPVDLPLLEEKIAEMTAS
jgi:cytochrome c biogenesis protein CcmG, thiol:disulfide interchange protein DsbE